MIGSLARYSLYSGFLLKQSTDRFQLQGIVDRFSGKLPFLDIFSFNVVDRQDFLQGTVDRFSCKVQFIHRFSFKAVDRLVSLPRYSG